MPVTILALTDGFEPESRSGGPLSRTTEEEERGFAASTLGWPMSTLLGLIVLIQIGSWLPHYLTWPYWADHDVFANAARAWDLGERPYRQTRLNNFPGTVFLFYALGKLGGWGRSVNLYVFDSGLLLTLVASLLTWSRSRFGRILPGLVGSLAFLSYYLGLDYTHTAQRDWHTTCLAVLGLMIAQTWPGSISRLVAAMLVAMAMATRPQAVLFLPALLLGVDGGVLDESAGRRIRQGLIWLVMVAGFLALAFLPIVIAGVFGDFLGALRQVSYGSTYNKVSPATMAKAWLLQAAAFRWLVVPAAILLLATRSGARDWQTARAWLVAMAGVSLYKPISPMAHSYLDLPIVLVWSVNLAVLAGMLCTASGVPAASRLAGVLALLGMGATTARPEFCVVGPCLRADGVIRSGVEPEEAPPGYRKGSVATSAFYPWEDYRGVLSYLRRKTSPTTKVANVLKGDPAIVSAVDRSSAFPTESVAWLRMVNGQDEEAFAESLRKADDSVVVWSPDEVGPNPSFRTELIDDEIRRLYEFEEVFGPIQVWRRKVRPTPP